MVKDANSLKTSTGLSMRMASYPGLLTLESEMTTEKLDSVAVVETYTHWLSVADATLLAMLICTLVKVDSVAFRKNSVMVLSVAVKDRPDTVELAFIVAKAFVTVDDNKEMVTLDSEPRTAALCSVLETMLRVALCSVPD